MSHRRVLIDMHIPDWDQRFLQHYDPAAIVDRVASTGADAMMLYFQSHTGLCYWPTKTGQQHRACQDTDPVAIALLRALHHRLPVCAYYSINFNNWAAQKFPDWKLEPAAEGLIGGGLLHRPRYGVCCLNHPEYRQFVLDQLAEIVTNYAVDAVFCDMLWWMSLCVCRRCRERYRVESGKPIPETIDWLDPDWCEFQAARERWVTELAIQIRQHIRDLSADTDVYHNFALAAANWTRGVGFSSARGHDFLGGDFYGGAQEQLLISKLMLNLSPNRPVEFMTTIASNLAEYEQLKSARVLGLQNLTATASGSAYMMIAALDPDGRINPAAIARCRESFEQAEPYAAYAGGEPVEDIGVYFSDDSKMSFADNGKALADAPVDTPMDYPHLDALTGVCNMLQRAHLPFGVITRKQLPHLNRYRVVVLPNVLRMDDTEVSAIRRYVGDGGHIYASGYTSLTATHGVRHEDFALADVFGCHFEQTEPGTMIYLEPARPMNSEAIAGQRLVSQRVGPSNQPAALRITKSPAAEALMTLNLPYGYPSKGAIDGKDWASIHSSPPWQSTGFPSIVRNRFGKGQAIYCAASIESGPDAAHEALFTHMIRLLGADTWSATCNAGSRIRMSAFRQPDKKRWMISFLHVSDEVPAPRPGKIKLGLCVPPGMDWTSLTTVPDGSDLNCSLESGRLVCTFQPVAPLTMIAANYRD